MDGVIYIEGIQTEYSVSFGNRYVNINFHLGKDGSVKVSAPPGTERSAIEAAIRKQSHIISERIVKLRRENIHESGRSQDDLEKLLRKYARAAYFTMKENLPEGTVIPPFPSIHMRLMKKASSYSPESNRLSFSKSLISLPKSAVVFAAADAVIKMGGDASRDIRCILFDKLCPDWRTGSKILNDCCTRK